MEPKKLEITDGMSNFDKETYLQTMGEKIISLRQLCHRRCLWYQKSLPNFNNDTESRYQYIHQFRHFPFYPGYNGGGVVNNTLTFTNYRFVESVAGLRIDEVITEAGFAGVEDTDWETLNIF